MKRILVLESGKKISNMIKSLFREKNFQIYLFEHYLSSNLMIHQLIYDLIVADLTSIKKDKVELLLKLKESNYVSSIPFLLITSSIDTRKAGELVIENFSSLNYYLKKPFTPEEIYDLINRILKKMDSVSPW